MPQLEPVRIETISQGAAIERLNLELESVLKNIADPNTSPVNIREINLKIKIKPSEDRSFGEVSIQATSKLAPVVEQITQLYFGKDEDGNPEASEVVQPQLFPEFNGNITQIKQEAKS
ncbi:hypothetical protein [Desulfobacter postgatei]|uniref:hypothetical protein n=1 Tax=Desulfobacter postgatei TaxID=2293 RepID=UPI002FDB4C1D